jgi:hypothetical protein
MEWFQESDIVLGSMSGFYVRILYWKGQIVIVWYYVHPVQTVF